ncbi:murein biosynthesis integral membrane protein MurJ [Nocardioides caldifontis]|uniref:murein biosynthesis integral membrane protein MurJ n=1 Tax=Nocardioides caldifontis TaxID=2588938 RepID=UPI001EF1384E|nr:murein biosynthesis integral membrane protein MurJ [Nocardioides caldifontis]
MTGPRRTGPSVLASSAVMAAGTVVSRLSGFVRSMLLAAALGTQLHADVFTIANTVPNMLYILLAGGVFNAVLVPQLVRAMEQDPDGGEGYTNRIITVAALFLAGVTALLVVFAPLLMRLYLDGEFFTDALADQRESVIDFARLCLPQVFFYGMFVLLGQVLNARDRFGPMMWAPIANNVISIAVLLLYLVIYGAASGDELRGGFTSGQEWLLGLGSTIGIAAQLLVLLPYLRAAGVRFRPRFDLRGSGLGHTLRLGAWTVGFVVVNQIAYTVVVRLASSGTADAASGSGGTGYTVYSGAFLLVMVPHSIATVSLATATLPRLSRAAAEGDLPAVARQVSSTTRTALALIVPFALLLPSIALPLANLLWGYAAAAETYSDFSTSLALFAPGLVFFTVHYLVLRGFYALEQTRTVFWVQCVIAAVNIALAVTVTSRVEPEDTAPGLVAAYGGAYAVGAVLSFLVLRRVLGGLDTPVLVRFLVRLLLAAGIAGAVAWGWRALLDSVWTTGDGKVQAVVLLGTTGVVDLAVFLLLARAMRIEEVQEVVGLLTARLRKRSGTGAGRPTA